MVSSVVQKVFLLTLKCIQVDSVMLVTTGLHDQVGYTACAKMGKWDGKSVCVLLLVTGKPGVIKVTRRRGRQEEIISHIM